MGARSSGRKLSARGGGGGRWCPHTLLCCSNAPGALSRGLRSASGSGADEEGLGTLYAACSLGRWRGTSVDGLGCSDVFVVCMGEVTCHHQGPSWIACTLLSQPQTVAHGFWQGQQVMWGPGRGPGNTLCSDDGEVLRRMPSKGWIATEWGAYVYVCVCGGGGLFSPWISRTLLSLSRRAKKIRATVAVPHTLLFLVTVMTVTRNSRVCGTLEKGLALKLMAGGFLFTYWYEQTELRRGGCIEICHSLWLMIFVATCQWQKDNEEDVALCLPWVAHVGCQGLAPVRKTGCFRQFLNHVTVTVNAHMCQDH